MASRVPSAGRHVVHRRHAGPRRFSRDHCTPQGGRVRAMKARTTRRPVKKTARLSQAETTSAPGTIPKAATGIEGLDELTAGGLPRGRPTLVCGSAGAGKTLLAMEFL